MVTTTLAALFGLALVDSINPSALVVTLSLLARAVPLSRIASYIAAIFATYLTLGVLLVLGVDTLLSTFGEAFESSAAYAIEGVVGAAMLIYSFRPLREPEVPDARIERASTAALAGTFALGVVITVLEFPTAFPYLAAISLLADAELSAVQWLTVLLVYNVIFVVPPTALVVGHMIAGRRLGPRYDRLRARLQRGARETMLWIIGAVGFFLLLDSLSYFGVDQFLDRWA